MSDLSRSVADKKDCRWLLVKYTPDLNRNAGPGNGLVPDRYRLMALTAHVMWVDAPIFTMHPLPNGSVLDALMRISMILKCVLKEMSATHSVAEGIKDDPDVDKNSLHLSSP